jgi:hypothetical protein
MSADQEIPMAFRIYLPGRRVKFTAAVLAAGVVPAVILRALLLRPIPMPGGTLKLNIEFEHPAGIETRLFDPGDVVLLPIDEEELHADLVGRKVHFPRKSGIGLDYPKDAEDVGEIIDASYDDGGIKILVLIPRTDGVSTWLTAADFTQCELSPRSKEKPPET